MIQHKFKSCVKLPGIILLMLLNAETGFSQTEKWVRGRYQDIGTALFGFAENNAGRMNVTADMGLNWSEAYIGELISYPPHYGFGGTIGMNSFKSSVLNDMLDEALAINTIDPAFSGKHLYPTFLAEMRLGGFRSLPFDIGFKIGGLPTFLPLHFFGDFSYSNLQFGGDIRYNICQIYTGFKASVGFGVNYLSGYIELSNYQQPWSDEGANPPQGGTPNTTDVFNPQGAAFRLHWNTLSFSIKAIVQKSFRMLGFTLFGGVVAGYGFSESGVAFIGENMLFTPGTSGTPLRIYDMTGPDTRNLENVMRSKIGNVSSWTIGKISGDDFGMKGTMKVNSFAFHTYEGIALDLQNDWCVQFALIFDLWNLEYGLSIGFRWQQREF
ncbi:MAG: hypothetical protein LBD22_00410 [Spirochaetaceae bacterium]|jgi:hypothetical protein|nr:hypothetical protein [Spirochaetaceae bacterium]